MLVLNYHRVGVPPESARYRGMYVSPGMLAWHIRLLKLRGFEFVTVSAGVARGCRAQTVAITFDDGYRDNLELGLPVLNRFQVPATVYVVTGDVGKQGVIWQEAGDKVSSNLMSWADLRQLQASGWEIGSHAADHVHLDRRSRTEQEALIQQSWDDITHHLGAPPRSFAYPYGAYNQDTLNVLKDIGAANAVTTKSDAANTPATNVLQLYRQPARGHHVYHGVKALRLLLK